MGRIRVGPDIVAPAITTALASAINVATELRDDALSWVVVALLTVASSPIARAVSQPARADVALRRTSKREERRSSRRYDTTVSVTETTTFTVTGADEESRAELLRLLLAELKAREEPELEGS